MNYIIEFEIAAVLMLLLLIVMYHIRRNAICETGKAFANLLYLELVCTISNLITVFTLENIAHVPLGFNYFVNILYLFTYNASSIAVFLYISKAIGSKKLLYISQNFSTFLFVLLAVLLLPTPWTGFIISLKHNTYTHGSGMIVLYGISVTLLVMIFYILLCHKKDMDSFQFWVMIAMNAITISAIILQLFIPSLLIQNFAITLSYYMLYISLQNPDDFMDKFTGCRNRQYFYRVIEDRTDNKISLVGFAIENLIQAQTILGFDETGRLLNTVSIFLMKQFGKNNVYHATDGRYIILLENEDCERCEEIISCIRTYFQSPISFGRLNWRLSPNFLGIREQEISINEVKEILESAFFQLENGKNKEILCIDDKYINKLREEKELVRQLKQAVIEKRFEVYYQPIYHLEEKRYHSAEALVRFFDENGKMVSPEYFIPVAERNGIILEIGEIILDKVCHFLKNEPAADLFDYIEINLSMVQCVQENLPSIIIQYAEKYHINPSRLNFEITETAEIENEEVLMHNMQTLCNHGFSFSLDDYGTGFSTASYLAHMPLEIVKIDKSILWNAMNNEKAMCLFESIVAMIKQLNKKIVVEGIESEQMVVLLQKLGCDYLQGFFYSKPLSETDLRRFISNL